MAENDDYIRILSHQLKSPINAIESLLKTITEGYAGAVDEKTNYLIEKAIKRSTEAREIIGDLLDYELYSENAIDKKPQIDLTDICAVLSQKYIVTAAEKNISLRLQIPYDESIIISADKKGIEHVLRNLLENAIKYTPERKSIVFKLSANIELQRCLIEIADTGSGIPAKELDDLFMPFYRSSIHKSTIPGTGLGLAIVKKVVDAHNGVISVKSEIGKGSTFTIDFPLIKVEKRTASAQSKKRIVIIGGVTAGSKTAARLRRLDEELDITIIEKGEFLSYAGCGLPWYISGKVNSPRQLMTTGDGTVRDIHFFESIGNIRVLNKTLANFIDRQKQYVEVEELGSGTHSIVPYDVLVLATGALPAVPEIPGVRQSGIFTLRSLEDAEAIKHEFSAGAARDVYIIGGGLIGISAAEEFLDAGARITIIEKKDYILLNLLDQDMADRIQVELEKKGIKIHTGIKINEIEKKGDGLHIRTTGGSFTADIIILSTGVTPNVEIAKQAGLKIGESGGIKVNSLLQTTDEKIYAVGDCAESLNIITGKHEYWPLGSVSTKMGRIAADNISGRREEFEGSIGSALFKMRDISVGRTGLTTRSAWKQGYKYSSVIVTGRDRAHYTNESEYMILKIIADSETRVILGAQAMGHGNIAGKIELLAFAIMNSMTLVHIFKADIGYSPAFNNPIDFAQTACLALNNKLDGLIRTISPEELEKETGKVNIISVCPPGEYSQSEIPGSINIPLERIRNETIPFDPASRIVLYSRTSTGAYVAYRYLTAQGFVNLFVLEGGFLFWRK